MNQSNIHLLDLPDEILLIILKNLNNIDVLYSLLNIGNQRLHLLARQENFNKTLDFRSIDITSSTDQRKLDRLCTEILPRIHYNVRCFILETVSMERILLAANYPNLTELRLWNFGQEIALHHFTDQSSLRYLFREQITDLILANSDSCGMLAPTKNYTTDVYGHILNFFKNLKRLDLIEKFNPSYPILLLRNLPSSTFFSSTLTYLCINMYTLDDCLCLLDGRLKQLSTFIVEICYIDRDSSIIHNMDHLPNLKCFSFKYYSPIDTYDQKILPLLRRMSYLEKLTLYLCTKNRTGFIDGTHLQKEILVYMSQLHSFSFYISTYHDTVGLFPLVSSQDIQQLVINNGHQRMATIVNVIGIDEAVCHIFSLPFIFDRLEDIGNIFPDTAFSYVTYLLVHNVIPFNHEFFARVARSFPSLVHLRLMNIMQQSSCNIDIDSSDDSQADSIAEYSHLTSLDVRCGHDDYVNEFLNERKACVPSLTELTVVYNDLRIVTKNFTKEETRRNCANVKRLIFMGAWVHPEEFYIYFPLL